MKEIIQIFLNQMKFMFFMSAPLLVLMFIIWLQIPIGETGFDIILTLIGLPCWVKGYFVLMEIVKN